MLNGAENNMEEVANYFKSSYVYIHTKLQCKIYRPSSIILRPLPVCYGFKPVTSAGSTLYSYTIMCIVTDANKHSYSIDCIIIPTAMATYINYII